jgi:hypothetical protein
MTSPGHHAATAGAGAQPADYLSPQRHRLRPAAGGRSKAIRRHTQLGEEDERDALINTRAMASTGTVFVLLLTACIVLELVRGTTRARTRT